GGERGGGGGVCGGDPPRGHGGGGPLYTAAPRRQKPLPLRGPPCLPAAQRPPYQWLGRSVNLLHYTAATLGAVAVHQAAPQTAQRGVVRRDVPSAHGAFRYEPASVDATWRKRRTARAHLHRTSRQLCSTGRRSGRPLSGRSPPRSANHIDAQRWPVCEAL